MLVKVEWDDDTHRIIVLSYSKGWTWEDQARARVNIDAMAASVSQVDIIADVVGANQLPPGDALKEMTAALHAAPDNIGMLVVVGSGLTMRAMIHTIKTVTFNRLVRNVYVKVSIDEARAFIHQQRTST